MNGRRGLKSGSDNFDFASERKLEAEVVRERNEMETKINIP